MKRINFTEAKFDAPAVLIIAPSVAVVDVIMGEFQMTAGIKFRRVYCPHAPRVLNNGESSTDNVQLLAKYIGSILTVAAMEVELGMSGKEIVIVSGDYMAVKSELNHMDIPYYWIVPSDDRKTLDMEVDPDVDTSETQVIFGEGNELRYCDFVAYGLRNAGVDFHISGEAGCRLAEQLAKEFDCMSLTELDLFVDSYGHLVIRSTDPLSVNRLHKCFHNAGIDRHLAKNMGCIHPWLDEDNNVIVFNHSDALAVLKLLDKWLVQEGKTDAELLCDEAISYDRLYDVVNRLIYPLVE